MEFSNKITSNDLQKLSNKYQHKYNKMNNKELIGAFIDDMHKYMKFDLGKEKYWHNPKSPQDFLLEMAKVGTLEWPIYYGYIPREKEIMLKPYIEKLIVKVFQLQNFDGFYLKFKYSKTITNASKISLRWGGVPKNRQHRYRQESRSHTIEPIKRNEFISDAVAKSIIVPIYDPQLISREQMMEEIKHDIKRNISNLRREIKRDQRKKRADAKITELKIEELVEKLEKRSEKLDNNDLIKKEVGDMEEDPDVNYEMKINDDDSGLVIEYVDEKDFDLDHSN